MTPPVLSGGSPRRLYHYAGKWVLEVVRHVNLGPDLVRPRTERLSGQRAIASYFKNNPDKATLAKATQRLMQTDPGTEAQSFNLEGSEWIANSIPPPPPGAALSESLRPPPEPPSIETEVAALKAQVVVLTAVQEGLIARLARLEGKVSHGPAPTSARAGRAPAQGGARRTRAAVPAARAAAARAGDTREPEADEPLGDTGGREDASAREEEAAGGPPSSSAAESAEPPSAPSTPAPPSSAIEPAAAAEASASPAAGADPPASAGPERALLALPPVADLARSVALLIGGDLTVQAGTELAVNRTTKDCYAAPLLDESDQTVGMILLNLEAAVFLGGTLMMLPRSELDQQLQALAPGEDSIAAAAEVCNALAAVVCEKGQQVRAGPLEKFEFKSWSWIRQPADRRDLEDSFGGRIVVAARPPPVQIF